MDVPEITRRTVLDLASARRDIDAAQEVLSRQCSEFDGVIVHGLDPESGGSAAFRTVSEAILAACEIQVELTAAGFPARIGLTTRQASAGDGLYPEGIGARIESMRCAAQAGQVVLDQATREIAVSDMPDQFSLVPLGSRIVDDRSGSERLYQLAHVCLAREFAVPRGADPAFSLPSSLTAFVGRWDEIQRVLERFYFSRVVTICGAGGIGKTRTAIQVGHEMVERQADGVWFVDLSGLQDGRLVAHSILRALPSPCPESGSALDRLALQLRSQEALLILDNVEHLLSDTSKVVSSISTTCPNVQFLVTSREPLGIVGESVIRLGPLRTPPENCSKEELLAFDSVNLLLDRVRVQNPDFDPSDHELAAVAEACREVDGIPLAIEIVASRLSRMPAHTMIRSLRSRAQGLRSHWREHGERHSHLLDALEWGYEDLKPQERLALHRSSVFVGGFTLDAAQQVCADKHLSKTRIRPGLDSLVRCSLLRLEGDRYRMLEPLREFARARLAEGGESLTVLDNHLEWAITLAEKADAASVEDRPSFFERLVPEISNLRAALEWARSKPYSDAAFRLAYALYEFWYMGSMIAEGRNEIQRVLRVSRKLHWFSRIRLLNAQAVLEMNLGNLTTARDLYDAAARLAKKHGDEATEVRVLANLAIVLRRLGLAAQAYTMSAQLLDRMPERNDSWAIQQINTANCAVDLREFDDAKTRTEETARYAAETGSLHLQAQANLSRGMIALAQLQFDEGQEVLERAFLAFRRLADVRASGVTLALLALAVEGTGLARQAVGYLGCFARLRETIFVPASSDLEARLEACRGRLRALLGESDYGYEFDRGRMLSLGDLEAHLRARVGEMDSPER